MIENPSTWAQAGLKHRPYPCQREGRTKDMQILVPQP